MVAHLQVQGTNILQHIDRITSIVKISSLTDRIKKYVPLKSLEEIKQLETLLQETFINEYKIFIQNISGHTLRENIRNALSRIFSNKYSMKCSWKNRRQNFGVYKLRLIVLMKEIILEAHAMLTEKEFNDIAAEWFQFEKQRYDREARSQAQNERCDSPQSGEETENI